MKARMITIPEKEYEKLKRESIINMGLVKKIRRSLENIKQGRIREWKGEHQEF